MHAFRLDHPRTDRVHANLARTELLRQHAGDRVDGGLCRRVHRGVRRPHRARARADVDHAPTLGPHVLHGLLRCQQETEDVDVEVPVKEILGHCLERGELVDTGVVDQDVEPAEHLFHL